jgi:HD-GYP domain-containing protein (c-di-GMP phosphodiesterase class II)
MSTVRNKIMLAMLAVILFSTLSLGFFYYGDSRSLALGIMKESNQNELKDIADYYFEKLILDMEHAVTVWAENPYIVNYQPAEGQPHMTRTVPVNFTAIYQEWMGAVNSSRDFTWVYLGLALDGSIFIAPLDPSMPLDYDCRARGWYQEAVERRGQVVWSEPYLDAGDSGKIVQTVSKTVYRGEELVGVIGVDITLDKFTEIIKSLALSRASQIYLLKDDNQVLAHSGAEITDKDYEILSLMQSGMPTQIVSYGQDQFVASVAPLRVEGWRLVAINKTSISAELGRIRTQIVIVVLAMLLASLLIAVLLANNILQPLKVLRGAADQVSSGNFAVRTKLQSVDEFGLLSVSFDRMLDQIQQLLTESRRHAEELEGKNLEIEGYSKHVLAMNEQLEMLLEELQENYLTTVRVLANAIEASDEYTRGHCDRVGRIAMQIAERSDLTETQQSKLEFACVLHDVGKIGISERILNKPGRLTAEEYEIIKRHPSIGYEMIREVPFLREAAEILLQHHERIDGKGYPSGLSGRQIRPEARIIAVADSYDAMSTARVYRQGVLSEAEIRRELLESRGTQLDPQYVDILLDILSRNNASSEKEGNQLF